jgi:hypothetical protein
MLRLAQSRPMKGADRRYAAAKEEPVVSVEMNDVETTKIEEIQSKRKEQILC